MDANASPPAGFEPLFRSSPFSETVGPFFYRKEPDGSFVVGMRVLPKHANGRGRPHGGLLLTLLDIALGYRAAFSQEPPAALTTATCPPILSARPRWAIGSKPTSTCRRSARALRSRTRFWWSTTSASCAPTRCSRAAAGHCRSGRTPRRSAHGSLRWARRRAAEPMRPRAMVTAAWRGETRRSIARSMLASDGSGTGQRNSNA
jgi:hypothetical protein